MTHAKGEQVEFNYISIGRYYIIEDASGREMYVYVTAADFDEHPGRTQIHYRIHEMRIDGQWSPYSLSVPYCPEGTFTDAEGIKVFETEQPPLKRRRRGGRSPY
jgi:hypothetical protein